MARTTCQSFSIRPSPPGRSLLAISSTRRRSSTLETHQDTVEADLAADALIDRNAAAGRYLRGFSGAIVLLKTCWRGLNAETPKRFIGKSAQTLNRGRRAVQGRWPCARIEARSDSQERALTDELPQYTTPDVKPRRWVDERQADLSRGG